MSTSKPSPLAPINTGALLGPAATAAAWVLRPVRATAFWSAVALPLVYLPLIATGAVWKQPLAFCALLALNFVAFLVGHGHNPQND